MLTTLPGTEDIPSCPRLRRYGAVWTVTWESRHKKVWRAGVRKSEICSIHCLGGLWNSDLFLTQKAIQYLQNVMQRGDSLLMSSTLWSTCSPDHQWAQITILYGDLQIDQWGQHRHLARHGLWEQTYRSTNSSWWFSVLIMQLQHWHLLLTPTESFYVPEWSLQKHPYVSCCIHFFFLVNRFSLDSFSPQRKCLLAFSPSCIIFLSCTHLCPYQFLSNLLKEHQQISWPVIHNVLENLFCFI